MIEINEENLIKDFLRKRKEYEESENIMTDYFKSIVYPMIENSKSKDDLVKIKERLIPMPVCASKVLLFNSILIKEKDFE